MDSSIKLTLFFGILACLLLDTIARNQNSVRVFDVAVLQFGEYCNSTQLCDPSADLICSAEGICECSVPDFMLYDIDQGKCVSLTGLNGSCYMQPLEDFQRTCVKHAECRFRPVEEISTPTLIGYCKCSQGFAEYADLTCGNYISTQSFGEKCNASHYCNTGSVLKCSDYLQVDGQCECVNVSDMEFDLNANSCLGLSVPGSVCYTAAVGGIQIRCTDNAECISHPSDPSGISGFCSCAFGYSATPEGKCVRIGQGYGESCDSTNLCSEIADLVCSSDGICTCSEPDTMVYEEHQDKCVSLAGLDGTCHFAPIGDLQRTCASYSQCTVRPEDDPNTDPNIGYCKCVSGYTPYEDRTCGVYEVSQTFGDRCNSSHFCNGQSILKCSDVNQIDGLCECIFPETMAFEEDSKSCFSLADPESICYLEPIGGIQLECIENADCIANPEDASGKSGNCQCSENYAAYQDRYCRALVTNLGYGQSCNSSHTCNRASVFACENELCECMPNTGTFYQESTETCVSGVGENSICNLNPIDDVQIRCDETSGCFQHPDNITGYCICLPGLVPIANTCVTPRFDRKYGDPCNSTSICDSNDLLSCDPVNETCVCKYTEDSYNSTAGRCVSPFGGLCYTEEVHGEIRNCGEPLKCTLPSNGESEKLPYGTCSCSDGLAPDEDGSKCVKTNSAELLAVPVLWLFIQQMLVRFV